MRIEGLDRGLTSVVSHPWAKVPAHGWGTQRAPLRMTERLLNTRSFHPVTERSGCRWGSHSI
jgi:hypothetical protein